MREIKFRGKTIDKKSIWRYGDLTHGENYYAIGRRGVGYYVDKNTIGQYTGLKDKNGTEIYEGDIIYYAFEEESYDEGEVTFTKGSFCIDNDLLYPLYSVNEIEVIGNKFEGVE